MAKVIPVKISVLNTFNQVVEYVNKQEEIPREMQVIDTKFEIIHNNLIEVSKRALELNDEKLMEIMNCLGYLK